MTSNALEKAFSKSAIEKAWKKHKDRYSKTTSAGVDNVTLKDFKANFKNEASEISALIAAGKYTFRQLRPFAIPKSNGKTRLINVPTIRDRFVQRILLDYLIANYGTRWKLPNSFTSMGINGEGVHEILQTAAKEISYTDYIVKADLSKFFDTIDRAQLKAMIKKRVRQSSLHPILFSVIDCETAARSREEKILLSSSGILREQGIRQGMPLSPVLAYLFLEDVDRGVGGRFYRYVDDLLFIGGSKGEAVSMFEKYKRLAEARGLTIHPMSGEPGGKTQLIGPAENFEFLGMTIDRKPSGNTFLVPSDSKKRIRDSISDALVIDPKNKMKQKGWLYSNLQRATNLVRNYKSAYQICDDWTEFERELKQLQLSMCREIAKRLNGVRNSSDSEKFLRLFGI